MNDSQLATMIASGVDSADQHFREILELLPAAIYTTDAEGLITYYNKAAADLWGCEPELGTSRFCGSWKLYWPDGQALPHNERPMAMTLQDEKPHHGMEAVAERPDGIRVPFIHSVPNANVRSGREHGWRGQHAGRYHRSQEI